MSTNLAGGVCIGQLNVCILRLALLDSDCTPTGGTSSGIVTAGLVTLTADPDIKEGKKFEPENGCGDTLWTFETDSAVKRWNLSGELYLTDFEMMKAMFGGDVILGASGAMSGEVIGYAHPKYTQARRNGVYLEVITQAVAAGSGDCQDPTGVTAHPAYVGHVFGKCRLVPGSRTFENEAAKIMFTGTATNNPYLTNGPWNDYPGAGYMPDSPHFEFGYTQAQYDTIAATVGCGWKDLPAGS